MISHHQIPDSPTFSIYINYVIHHQLHSTTIYDFPRTPHHGPPARHIHSPAWGRWLRSNPQVEACPPAWLEIDGCLTSAVQVGRSRLKFNMLITPDEHTKRYMHTIIWIVLNIQCTKKHVYRYVYIYIRCIHINVERERNVWKHWPASTCMSWHGMDR